MSTIKTFTLEEIQNLPPLSAEEKSMLENGKVVYSEDCPKLSKEELEKFRPAYLRHPEHFKNKKEQVSIRFNSVLLAHFRESGKGWQTKVNDFLMDAYLEGRI